MKTPSLRPNPERIDKHHMNWRRKEWVHASEAHRNVRELGAFSIQLPRHWHDRMHVAVDRVELPTPYVASSLLEIGKEYEGWADDPTRIENILDDMAGFVRETHNPSRKDEMLQMMSSYSAQLGILALQKSMI
jgi:hypothetical protein